MPMMRPRFAVTLPMALPMDISTMPMPLPGESASAARASSAAKMETSSSGKVVAKLTTVAPTISFGMPEASAIHDAASTKKSPPLMMSTRPTMSSKTVIAISICKFPFFTLSERFRFLLPQDYAEKDIISIIAGNRGKIQSYLPVLSNFTVLFIGPKATDELFELFGAFFRRSSRVLCGFSRAFRGTRRRW